MLRISRSVQSNRSSRSARRRLRGSVLIEFALVALVFYVLFAATIELGKFFLVGSVLQDAARVAAREMALTPLPASATFQDALDQVFDPRDLVVDLDEFPPPNALKAHLNQMKAVNKALVPLMVNDRPVIGGAVRNLLRFPGALIDDPKHPGGPVVAIPIVDAASSTATSQAIRWSSVIEFIGSSDPFPFVASDPQSGLAAVRINYPVQASSLSGFAPGAGGPGEPNGTHAIVADDSAVTELNTSPGALLVDGDSVQWPWGANSGRFGLGRQLAFGKAVRPFRRVFTAQAIFRREVFGGN